MKEPGKGTENTGHLDGFWLLVGVLPLFLFRYFFKISAATIRTKIKAILTAGLISLIIQR